MRFFTVKLALFRKGLAMKEANVLLTVEVPAKIAVELRYIMKRNDLSMGDLVRSSVALLMLASSGNLFVIDDEARVAQLSIKQEEVGE